MFTFMPLAKFKKRRICKEASIALQHRLKSQSLYLADVRLIYPVYF